MTTFSIRHDKNSFARLETCISQQKMVDTDVNEDFCGSIDDEKGNREVGGVFILNMENNEQHMKIVLIGSIIIPLHKNMIRQTAVEKSHN